MPDQKPEQKGDAGARPGSYRRALSGQGVAASDIIAFVLSLMWLAVFGWLFARAGGGGGAAQTAMVLVAVVLPVALIWLAALAFRTTRVLREEARRLHDALEAMREAHAHQAQAAHTNPIVEKRLDEIAEAARNAEQAMAKFVSIREAAVASPAAARTAPASLTEVATGVGLAEQPGLALGTPPEAAAAPVSTADMIKALNFPDGPEDTEGFRALRRALGDHQLSRIVRAAQDVLTLLSQDGIYMDDLKPDRARPELWRRFAQGERGRTMAGLGGVRDRSSLALSASRMRKDTIFRDAAHHFMRQFDKTLAEFEKTASDAELVALSETRTARAFMLLGRVAGVFD